MSIRKSKNKEIATERIERLLNLASKIFEKRPELAHRHVELAWRLKTKYNLRLSPGLKRKFCRKCQTLWVPGKTCRVRLKSSGPSYISITCENCGHVKRIPYKEDE